MIKTILVTGANGFVPTAILSTRPFVSTAAALPAGFRAIFIKLLLLKLTGQIPCPLLDHLLATPDVIQAAHPGRGQPLALYLAPRGGGLGRLERS
jgi:hypothetical protein